MYQVDHLRLQTARAAFAERGESIADWAKRNEFRPQMVYAILAGRNKGMRGEGHHIAVALGIKARHVEHVVGQQKEKEKVAST